MTPQELNQVYEFVEPHYTGGVAHVRLTAEMAIAAMREYVNKLHPDKSYDATDERLLEEFIIVNWAYPLKGVFEEDDTRTT